MVFASLELSAAIVTGQHPSTKNTDRQKQTDKPWEDNKEERTNLLLQTFLYTEAQIS